MLSKTMVLDKGKQRQLIEWIDSKALQLADYFKTGETVRLDEKLYYRFYPVHKEPIGFYYLPETTGECYAGEYVGDFSNVALWRIYFAIYEFVTITEYRMKKVG